MKAQYAQRGGEERMNWLRRIYAIAQKEAEEKGWAGVDPELTTILLNNMGTFLK